jgi:hypothetical protein
MKWGFPSPAYDPPHPSPLPEGEGEKVGGRRQGDSMVQKKVTLAPWL